MKHKILAVLLILVLLLSHPYSGPLPPISQNTVALAASTDSDQTELLSSRKQVVKAIRSGLLKRKAEIEVHFTDDVRKKLDDIHGLMDEVMAYDIASNAKDADYLAYSLTQWAAQMEWIAGRSATLTLTVSYKCTAKEEKALDKKVDDVLKSLKLEEASEEEKVRAIHDYIIKRVSYDTSYEKTSAYDALIGKSAVCEGYAMAAYLMFTRAGLDCRIISGTADGEAYAWNIVKVEGAWYNIDLTWDDPITADGKGIISYDYYLKSTADFKNHKRDSKYSTKEFVKAHPISKSSYVRSN